MKCMDLASPYVNPSALRNSAFVVYFNVLFLLFLLVMMMMMVVMMVTMKMVIIGDAVD